MEESKKRKKDQQRRSTALFIPSNNKFNEFKVVIVGELRAGKSSLVKRIVDKGFSEQYNVKFKVLK